MSVMSEQTSTLLVAPAFEPLVEKVRVARVEGRTFDPRRVDLGRLRAAEPGAVVVDVNNGLADVDARLSLAQIAAHLETRGWLLPLLRPLPAAPLWRLAMAAPIVVDAVAQGGVVITVDGDVFATPKAPRHSAGPSVLLSTATSTPFAFLTRARLRIAPASQTAFSREDFADAKSVARRVRALVDEGRVFGASARGTSLAILGGTPQTTTLPSTPWTTSKARWRAARSIKPGDVFAIEAALSRGHTVAVVPWLQRAAVLERAAKKASVVDVRGAAGALADALRKVTP